MESEYTIMAENIYFRYRKEAARYNEKLNSRAGASELLGISESSLTHYELGITKSVPVDVVVIMAELYNAPELRNLYCKEECPIGRSHSIATRELPIETVAVHLLHSMENADLKEMAKQLLRIASDGKITPEEAEELVPIQKQLTKISEAVSELNILIEKHKNGKEPDDGID
jgi:hypothetical protein